MVDKDILDPQFQDYKALEDSTVIHIRGLKLQLEVAYATLKRATECREATQKPEDAEQKIPKEVIECESTKTEDADTAKVDAVKE